MVSVYVRLLNCIQWLLPSERVKQYVATHLETIHFLFNPSLNQQFPDPDPPGPESDRTSANRTSLSSPIS